MMWTVHLYGGPKVVNHAAVAIDDYIYSFGGNTNIVGNENKEGILVYVLNVKTLRWSLVPSQCDANGNVLQHPLVPLNRTDHTAVLYNKKAYIWGGRTLYETNVLYCFDIKSATWTRPKISGSIPHSRSGHTACVVGHFMYVYGGYDDGINDFSEILHCLNLETFEWMVLETTGTAPVKKIGHSVVAINDRMYLFGGCTQNLEDNCCREMIYLDLKTLKWVRIMTNLLLPMGHYAHSMFCHKEVIYALISFDWLLEQHFTKLYVFNPKTNFWHTTQPRGRLPPVYHRQCTIVKDNRMFLLGGSFPMDTEEIHTKYFVMMKQTDTSVLDFSPSLKTLAMLAVVNYGLDTLSLPSGIKEDIRAITQRNNISFPFDC